MNRRDSSRADRRTNGGGVNPATDVDPPGEDDWLDGEILKVLMGADVEFESEDLGSTCVEEE